MYHPRQLTLECLVDLFGEHDWSREHRKGVRISMVSFCEWCLANGLMDHNPAMQLPKTPGDKPRPRPATEDIWRDLLDAAPPRERMMARLAGEAGLRRAEIAQCHRNDLVEDHDGAALIVHGKGHKQRVVPLTENLANAIRSYCPHGFVFPGQIDGHISADYVGTLISRLMPPGYTLHKLRHRFASVGYARTGNLVAVKEVLGHESIATTQAYVAVSRGEIRAIAEAAGRLGPRITDVVASTEQFRNPDDIA